MRRPEEDRDPGDTAAGAGAEAACEVPVRDLAGEREDSFRAIAELSRRFLNVAPGHFDGTMRDGLEAVARLADADRARFTVVRPTRPGLSGAYQWRGEGVPPRPELADWRREVEGFRWPAQRLEAVEILHLPRVAEIPPEAAAERESLESDGVTAYLAIPIQHEGRAVGFLDFARGERPRARDGWEAAEIGRLRLVAEVFGAAVRRLHLEQEVTRQLEIERRVGSFSRALLEHGAYEVDVGIRRGLEAAAAYVGADRSYLIADSGEPE